MKPINTVVILLLLFLSSCRVSDEGAVERAVALGPEFCGQLADVKRIKKMKQTALQRQSVCFGYSVQALVENDLVLSKALWLRRTEGVTASTDFLLVVLRQGFGGSEVHLQLAKNYYAQSNWALSQHHLEQIDSDDYLPLMQLLDYRQGNAVAHPEMLPLIYRGQPVKQAKVNQSRGSGDFGLQMVSDGDPNKINGEPSIMSSPDGTHVWVLWTDSGEALGSNPDYYYWDIESAQSSDGGMTWTAVDMDTIPGVVDRFHFDPMTAYDPNNQIIYAGGMVKGFSSQGGTPDDAFFVYRWELGSDSNSGPYKQYFESPDKALMTVDHNGGVFVAHHKGVDYSADLGETYTQISSQSFVGPHPRINSDNCLIITDMERTAKCDQNGIATQTHFFGSLSSFDAASQYIPGGFRSYSLVQNVITSNDDVYVVYTDLRQQSITDTTIYMSKSTDDGVSWSAPWQITPTITGDQFMPWIEVDSNDGLHVIYFDTRHVLQSDSNSEATLDLYYSYSSDLGQTWEETRVTPAPFTTPDLIWGDYFFTDYVSMSLSNDKIFIAFPWSEEANQMHLYVATKSVNVDDLIFMDGFD